MKFTGRVGLVNSIHRVGSYRGGVQKISLNNLICHKLGILSFLLTNYCQLLSG